MSDAILSYDVFARDRGASKVFEKVAGSADSVQKSFKKTQDGASALSAQFEKTKARVAELRAEFARTGDMALLKQIRKGERDLANLSGWAKHFPGQVAEGVGMVAKLGGKLTELGGSPKAGVLAAAAGVAGIPLGAAAAGAAVGAVGLGFLALGAMGVKGSRQVQTALTGLQATANSTMKSAASSMEKPIAGALETISTGVRGLGPQLAVAFGSVAPHVDNVARGVVDLSNNAMPGLQDAARESGVVLDMLGTELGDLGTSASNAFTEMSEGAEGGAIAISGLADTLGLAIESTGFLVGGMGKLTKVMGETQVGLGMRKLLDDVAGGEGKAAEKAKELAAAQAEATAEFEKSANALADYSTNLEIASGSQLGLSRAADEVIKSRLNLTQAVQANGTALTGNSEKAMANREALRQGVNAANQHATSLEKSGQSQGFATAQRQKDIDALRAWAIKQGMATKDVDAFLSTVNKVPPVKLTRMETPGSQAAFLSIARHNAEAARVPRQKGTTLSANVHYGSADAAARWRGAGPPAHRSATLHLNLAYGSADAAERWRAGASGGLVGRLGGRKSAPGFAGGGMVAGGGTTTSDSVPIWASRREFVTQASAVSKIGRPAMEFMNRTGTIPASTSGGVVHHHHNTFNINVPPGATSAIVAEEVVELIQSYERRNGTGWRS